VPWLLAWLFKIKFNLNVSIGRIGLGWPLYLILKEVHVTRNGFSIVKMFLETNLSINKSFHYSKLRRWRFGAVSSAAKSANSCWSSSKMFESKRTLAVPWKEKPFLHHTVHRSASKTSKFLPFSSASLR
jgi:hypothetical protein